MAGLDAVLDPDEKSTEDVDSLLLKIIDAPYLKEKRHASYGTTVYGTHPAQNLRTNGAVAL